MISGTQLAAVPSEQVTSAQTIVLDWHDGPRAGFLRLDNPSSTWYFRLYAQVSDPDDIDSSLFLLAPVADDTIGRLLDVLRPLGIPQGPHWTPLWRFPDEASQRRAEATIAEIVQMADPADVVVESRDLTQFGRMWPTVPPVSI